MILPFEPYNPAWKNQFNTITRELNKLLDSLKVFQLIYSIGFTVHKSFYVKIRFFFQCK